MGGFVLEEPGKPLTTLHPQRFHDLLVEGQIDFLNILEADIQDHSKADWLSKLVVVLQVSWFIVQCIARGVSLGLKLTELEVVTLAFGSLNAAMYFFWWYKPLDVKRPFRIPLKPPSYGSQICSCKGKENVEQRSIPSFERLPPNESAINVLRVWNLVQKVNKIPLLNIFTKPVTSTIWCQDHMIPEGAAHADVLRPYAAKPYGWNPLHDDHIDCRCAVRCAAFYRMEYLYTHKDRARRMALLYGCHHPHLFCYPP